MATIRSDSGMDSGFSRTLWTTEKRAVLAPMQSASVSAAVIENALSFHSRRTPTRRSFHIKDVDEMRRRDVRDVLRVTTKGHTLVFFVIVLRFQIEVVEIRRGAEARRSAREYIDEPRRRRDRDRFEQQCVDNRE